MQCRSGDDSSAGSIMGACQCLPDSSTCRPAPPQASQAQQRECLDLPRLYATASAVGEAQFLQERASAQRQRCMLDTHEAA